METQVPLIIESGTACPVSGIWKTIGPLTTTITVNEKSAMPTYCGVKVRWILLYHC
ncbi:hypothetical protein I6H88_21335 [Elizabethkingia bruuniana]|jgi:hypothetical protein|uniref:Uncharacterized protein n=1 Tax=Elizabethkingia bruuniana TaxID=1756149 RepID=A0A7T7ZYA6_9FLAO|nr:MULTISPECIES: hypothetical protein [Weeksellaceae]MCL1641537.1 hypothetical protein [Elizabethkingia anophelis]MCL1646348.1 hypothetical protein [Elizabethkingia anophelis]MCT3940430.1 hypothetical protein [Elizabethkingia anophelis]MCT4193654.1 hypothetical protein [Elizabethkingia anophelis]QQN58929.1 hypothetical protein I6H88_21335 [Elizabethkingia bruuniana]